MHSMMTSEMTGPGVARMKMPSMAGVTAEKDVPNQVGNILQPLTLNIILPRYFPNLWVKKATRIMVYNCEISLVVAGRLSSPKKRLHVVLSFPRKVNLKKRPRPHCCSLAWGTFFNISQGLSFLECQSPFSAFQVLFKYRVPCQRQGKLRAK